MKTARLKVDLACECGRTTEGFEVVLRKGGASVVPCPGCKATFLVTFQEETVPRLIIDPLGDGEVKLAAPPKGEPS